MTVKTMTYSEEAREKLQQGMNMLADVVKPTLGPRSRCVIMEKAYGPPLIINDGATIAKEIEASDHLVNIGVKMVREAATKTNDVAGDGTTTAILLTRSICREGRKMVTAGRNPMRIKQGIEKAVQAAVRVIQEMSTPADTSQTVVQVSTISANNDPAIGELIGQAMDKVGRNEVITIEESKGMDTSLEMVEGLSFDRGYLSPFFLTDVERRTCELKEPYLLIHEAKIASVRDLLPILQQVRNQDRPLIVIAEDVETQPLATLVVNKMQGIIKVCAVKAPGFGDRRKAMLEDIAVLTRGRFISKDLGLELAKVGLDVLGRAGRVVVSKEHTTIVDGAGEKASIEDRIRQIKREIDKTTSSYDREKLEERLAKLSGGVAVLKIGAATEIEMKEKKARVEDALNAARAAVEEGIVPGGGVAYLRCLKALNELEASDPDEWAGIKVLSKALKEPLRHIAFNAGWDGAAVVERVLAANGAYGFNAASERFQDLLEAGIIDPAKVVRVVLQNAASIASLMLTTEAAVSLQSNSEKRRKAAADSHES